MSNALIMSSPDILGGTPVFVGTRVPVKNLTDYLEAGDSLDEFLDDYPSVSRKQAIAFLEQAEPAKAQPMDKALQDLLAKVAEAASISEFSNVNATDYDGDNALHYVCWWGDLPAAKLLIDAGIDINKYGDLGYTPLHVACMNGHSELVALLVECGADLFAMSEGDQPFATARLSRHDHICDYLLPFIEKALAQDRHLYIKARIKQLKQEAERMESEICTLHLPAA